MTPGSSKKDTDLFLIKRTELDAFYNCALDYDMPFAATIEARIRSRPYNEELVWMTPEEEEKRIRQAAINGVLAPLVEWLKVKRERYGARDDLGQYANDDPEDSDPYDTVLKKIAALRQQQAPGTGGQG